MVKLIDRYGINIVKKGKIRYYSPKFKREMFDYYNNKRIGAKLKGFSPVQLRTKSFASINCLTFWGQYI